MGAPEEQSAPQRTLVIACGALARETLAVIEANGLGHMDVTCLPADLHARPQLIPEAMRARIREKRAGYERILCLYGDCGTGGLLDAVLAEEGVERIEGAHCYAFYAGLEDFEALQEEELGSFYLTDFMVRQFDAFVIRPLGLDRRPQLRDLYFEHYRRVVYLAQDDEPGLVERAGEAAARLGLPLVVRRTGMGLLAPFLAGREAA